MNRILSSKARRATAVVLGGLFAAGMLVSCTTTTPGGGAETSDPSADTLATAIENGYMRVGIANEPPTPR